VTYSIKIARSAARALTETLPEAVAAAAFGFVNGPLFENPHRVGKRLRPPLDGKWSARRGQYRVIYEIHDAETTVVVLQVSHRSDAYH
jgi:mRNA interferase RelE/StbE